jgi:hypothetical protein
MDNITVMFESGDLIEYNVVNDFISRAINLKTKSDFGLFKRLLLNYLYYQSKYV